MKRTGTVDEGSLKDTDHSSHSCNVLKDLLMQKLGETISPERIDFIMVHFQHACTHCCKIIESGERWVCKQCKQFQLCRKCHNAEQKLDMRDRHPVNSREHHFLRLDFQMVSTSDAEILLMMWCKLVNQVNEPIFHTRDLNKDSRDKATENEILYKIKTSMTEEDLAEFVGVLVENQRFRAMRF